MRSRGPNLFIPGNHPAKMPPRRSRRGYHYTNVVSVFSYPYPSNENGYIDIRAENLGGDHNEVWKYKSGETAVRITDSLPIGGTFRDYAVASGVTYFYFIRAVNADGSYIESATMGVSSTFSGFWLHAVAKADSTNALTVPLMFNAIPPQGRTVSRETQIFSVPSRTKVIMATGEATMRDWSVAIYSTTRDQSDTEALQAFAALKQTLCVRDGFTGKLMFGTLSTVPITYGVTSVTQLIFQETDYREAVA